MSDTADTPASPELPELLTAEEWQVIWSASVIDPTWFAAQMPRALGSLTALATIAMQDSRFCAREALVRLLTACEARMAGAR